MNYYFNFKNKGFTLIELTISLAVLISLLLAVYSLINFNIRINTNNEMLVKALELANQRMERIRNLPYVDVGTLAGSPHGIIQDTENVDSFTIHTIITYHDDNYDGTFTTGDLIWDDYKTATIEVSWNSSLKEENISIFSKIIPRTEETASGNGLLRLEIVDSNGNPVQNANIHIENNSLLPAINVDFLSDVNGSFVYSVLPSFEAYEITVTKAGYGIDKTYDRTIDNPNPTKPHLTVIEGMKTEDSFSIDLLSTLNIYTVTGNLPENWQTNTDTSGEDQINSQLAIDNLGYIYVVWQDYRQSSASKIFAQKYDQNGNAQWPNTISPEDQVISTANNTVVPDILVDCNGNLYISWHDDSVGNKEAYVVKRDSSDGDDLWGAEKKINTLADNDDQSHPRIALIDDCSTATTTVVWQDNRNTDLDIFLQIINPSGSLQLNPEIRINTNPISDGSNQYQPSIETNSNSEIFIVWTDDRNGDYDIYFSNFDDQPSQQWEIIANNDISLSNQYEPALALDSNNYIYVVWTDERNGNKDVYAQKFDTDGNVLWAADLKINTGSDTNDQYEPAIAIDSSNILFFVWTDERNGNQDIYAQKYDVDGNALWTDDLRVNINTDSSNQFSPDITISPFSDIPYASWNDGRNGDLDIYTSTFDTYTITGNLPDIPLNIVGTKRIGEDPIIYEYNNDFITDSNGFLSLQLEWDTPGYTITTTSTLYNIVFSDIDIPINLLANETKDIYLYLAN